jgi:hypothetical protein
MPVNKWGCIVDADSKNFISTKKARVQMRDNGEMGPPGECAPGPIRHY